MPATQDPSGSTPRPRHVVAAAVREARARWRSMAASARPRLAETWLWFPLFAFVLLVLTWGSLIHALVLERAAITDAAVKSSRELADTYEAQVVRSLVSIDQTLKTVAYAYAVKGDAAFADLQNRDMLPSAIVFRMTMTNRRGDIIASTRTHLSPSPNVADRPYFLAQRHGDRLFISRTAMDRETNAPEIIFSRRLSNAAGDFAGIVTLAVDPSYFTSNYDFQAMGAHGFLGLLGSDGSMRVQQSGDEVSWGVTVSRGYDTRAETEALGVQPWDRGTERFTNVRALRGFPLTVIVGLSRDEQLSRYRHDRSVYVGETAAGSLLLVVLATILSLKSLELSKSRARTRQLQQTYFAASDASLDAFFVWERVPRESDRVVKAGASGPHSVDCHFLLRDVSRRGLEIMGKSREALLGASTDAVFSDNGERSTAREFADVFETGEVAECDWQHMCPDGSRIWLTGSSCAWTTAWWRSLETSPRVSAPR